MHARAAGGSRQRRRAHSGTVHDFGGEGKSGLYIHMNGDREDHVTRARGRARGDHAVVN